MKTRAAAGQVPSASPLGVYLDSVLNGDEELLNGVQMKLDKDAVAQYREIAHEASGEDGKPVSMRMMKSSKANSTLEGPYKIRRGAHGPYS